METHEYQLQEALSPVPASQEVLSRTETLEPRNSEHGWLYYVFGIFIKNSTEELERALARLQLEEAHSRRMDFMDLLCLRSSLYKVGLELLLRRNPELRNLAEELSAIGKRKYELQRAWEKEIIAREGEEGLKRRNQNGEGPGRQYTREELDLSVRFTQAQVDAGILPPSALKNELEVREAGGYYQWEKEFDRKISENLIRKLAAVNDPHIAKVIQNIFSLSEEEYGKEYAEQQNAVLSELAAKTPKKRLP